MNTPEPEPTAALDQPGLRRSAAVLCATSACLGTLAVQTLTGSSLWALAWLPVAAVLAVALQDWLFARIVSPVAHLLSVVEGIARGEVRHRLRHDQLGPLARYGDTVNALCESRLGLEQGLSALADRLQQIPQRVCESMEAIQSRREATEEAVAEAGTLLSNIDTSMRGIHEEVESLSRSIEEASSSILEMQSSTDEVARGAGSLTESVDSSTSSIHEIGASIRQVAQSADAVQTMAEEAATAMVQMDRAIQEVSEHVREASGLTEAVSHGAELGQQAVSATIDGIEAIRDQTLDARTVLERLADRIGEIGEIVNVIGGINEETNLLSLNAAIIAAQAGEQGKAFAVVANHVKTLAQRTASSTQEIEALIRAVQVESGNAVRAMGAGIEAVEVGVSRSRSAGEALTRIRTSARDASRRVAEIARATGEQTRNSKHVAGVAQQTSQMVQQISTAMAEQSRASGVMLGNAEGALELCRQVHRSTEEQRESGRFISESIHAVSEMIRSIHVNTESHGVASQAVAEVVNRILHHARESGERIPEVLKDLEELHREADTLLRSTRPQPEAASPSSATPSPARWGSDAPSADGRI